MNDDLIWFWGCVLLAENIIYGNNVGKFDLFFTLLMLISAVIFGILYVQDKLRKEEESKMTGERI